MNEAALNRAAARADRRKREIVDHNRRLAALFDAFMGSLETVGCPEVLMVEGYDWRDVMTMLRDMRPDTSDIAAEAVYERLLEQEVGP